MHVYLCNSCAKHKKNAFRIIADIKNDLSRHPGGKVNDRNNTKKWRHDY